MNRCFWISSKYHKSEVGILRFNKPYVLFLLWKCELSLRFNFKLVKIKCPKVERND